MPIDIEQGTNTGRCTSTNSVVRRSRKLKKGLAGAVTATAMTVGLVSPAFAPEASADMTFDVITAGPLFWLLDRLGYDHIDTDAGPPIGTVTVNFDYTKGEPKDIYDAINAVPFSTNPLMVGTRSPIVLADANAAYSAVAAYRALIASAQGNTPEDYDPLAPNLVPLTPNQTNELIGLIRNPIRPNGGIYSRFESLADRFGIDSAMPDSGIAPDQVSGVKLNTSILDVSLAYDSMSDFPVTRNFWAIANSLVASFLPTYLLDGGQLEGVDMDALQDMVVNMQLGRAAEAGETLYGTFLSTDLPLLELMRWPAHVINFISQQMGHPLNLATPLADALQPALEILVNIGYTDVQTPTEGGTYNRTFDDAGVLTPFGSVDPLTPEERQQVRGDVIDALVNGFHGMFSGQTEPEDTEEEPAEGDDPQPQSGGGVDEFLNGIVQGLLNPAAASPAASAVAASAATASQNARPRNAGPAAKHSSAPSATNRDSAGSAHRNLGGSKRAAHRSASSD